MNKDNWFKKRIKNIIYGNINMASYQAFNSMMEEFLNELVQTFPEEKALKIEVTKFQALRKANSKKVVEGFMHAIGPYQNDIQQKNDKLMTSNNIEFLKKINIKRWWTKDLSENTKDAIWSYLQTLIMLGMTITSIPADMLKTIESVAEQCASSMDGDSNGAPNMGALFSGLQSMMSNLDNEKVNKLN